MDIILLKDCDRGNVDAVILTAKTTKEEIQNIIDSVKSNNHGSYSSNDIITRLPKDCVWFFEDEVPSVTW